MTPLDCILHQVASIPVGTLGAICGSYVMYMSFMFLWAGVGSRAYLQQDHGQINTLLRPMSFCRPFLSV